MRLKAKKICLEKMLLGKYLRDKAWICWAFLFSGPQWKMGVFEKRAEVRVRPSLTFFYSSVSAVKCSEDFIFSVLHDFFLQNSFTFFFVKENLKMWKYVVWAVLGQWRGFMVWSRLCLLSKYGTTHLGNRGENPEKFAKIRGKFQLFYQSMEPHTLEIGDKIQKNLQK